MRNVALRQDRPTQFAPTWTRLIVVPRVGPHRASCLAICATVPGALALVVVLSLVSTALSLTQPFLSKILVDRALIGRDMGVLAWTVGGFLALTGFSLVLNVVSGLRYTRVSANILFDMRLDVFRHLQRLSPRWFTRTPIGQIASRVNSDIAEIQRVAAEVALAWIGQVAYLVGSVMMLVLLDVRLFLVGLLALPVALWATVAYRRRLEGQVAKVRDHSAGVGTFLIEALQGMKLLVAHKRTAAVGGRVSSAQHGIRGRTDAMRKLTYLSVDCPACCWPSDLPRCSCTADGA
jgi:ATP-binding cassette subfamily B protein